MQFSNSFTTLVLAISILSILFLPFVTGAQENDSHLLFENEDLPVIEIEINADSLAWLLEEENLQNYRYLHASFHYQSATIDSVIEDVGFRLRGNTSRYSQKKSFKISFNAFEDNNRFYGLKKFNLNGEHNDPSIVRSKLSWDLFNDLGLPASRCTHVKLYVNGEYRGLYIHVEEYDKTFLRSHFTIDEGNFYKCLWPAPLEYLGDDPDLYKYGDSRRAYALKTNEEEDDYSDLAHFIDILNNTHGETFQDSLENNLNVLGFLQVQAIEVLIGHWDDYWVNQNNYWLYYNPDLGRFEFIPYDLDNTFGIRWDNNDWSNRHVRFWGPLDNSRPLVRNILNTTQYRNIYFLALNNIIENYFNYGEMSGRVDELYELIEEAAEEDYYRTYDYGWNFEDFQNSFNQGLGAHVPSGVNQYIGNRENSAVSQLTMGNIQPYFASKPEIIFLPQSQELEVSVNILDENYDMEVSLHLEQNTGFEVYEMLYVETSNYGVLPLHKFSITIPHESFDGLYSFYLESFDDGGLASQSPRNAPEQLFTYQFQGLFINEFLASNDSYGADEFGEYDDWVEIYNATSQTIFLQGYSLSDNPGNPLKWMFPNIDIEAGQYLIVWIDDDEEQGIMHTPFKLDADGEYVGLYRTENALPVVVDSVYFGQQQTDVSKGRFPDANPGWFSMTPSFGASNNSPSAVEEDNSQPASHVIIKNYPNPFNSNTRINFSLPSNSHIKLRVIDILGREVATLANGDFFQGNYNLVWNAENYPSGVYLLVLETANQVHCRKILLMR